MQKIMKKFNSTAPGSHSKYFKYHILIVCGMLPDSIVHHAISDRIYDKSFFTGNGNPRVCGVSSAS